MGQLVALESGCPCRALGSGQIPSQGAVASGQQGEGRREASCCLYTLRNLYGGAKRAQVGRGRAPASLTPHEQTDSRLRGRPGPFRRRGAGQPREWRCGRRATRAESHGGSQGGSSRLRCGGDLGLGAQSLGCQPCAPSGKTAHLFRPGCGTRPAPQCGAKRASQPAALRGGAGTLQRPRDEAAGDALGAGPTEQPPRSCWALALASCQPTTPAALLLAYELRVARGCPAPHHTLLSILPAARPSPCCSAHLLPLPFHNHFPPSSRPASFRKPPRTAPASPP